MMVKQFTHYKPQRLQTFHIKHQMEFIHSPIEDGVVTKGGYFLTNFKHNFSDDLKLDAKLRYSRYQHQFNLFLDGSGVTGAKAVETQQEYLEQED